MRVFTLSIMYSLLVLSMLYGEVAIGADVVSRYVWRGSDYGNAAAVQPGIETAVGPVTFGAWGSWSISPGPASAPILSSKICISKFKSESVPA